MSCSCSLARRPEAGTGRREPAGNCCAPAAVDSGTPRYLKPDGGQPWLEVGAADDPLEHEADAFSSAVTAGRSLPRFLSREQRAPLRRLGDPCAEECPPASAEERVADAAGSAASEACPLRRASLRADPPDDDDSTPRRGSGRAAGSGGMALPGAVKARLERATGADLGGVLVHHDSAADRAVRQVGARAFTQGEHIWLGGRERPDDLALMAHEVAHVVQQRGTAGGPLRRALDPTNTMAWSWFSAQHRRDDFRGIFDETLGAAPEQSLAIEESLRSGTGVPTDEASRARLDAAFTARMETLVRLNALGLMASHRAGIELKRDQLLNPDRVPEVARDGASDRTAAMASLRDGARALQRLNETRDRLQDSRSTLRGVSVGALHGDICLSMSDCITSWLEDIYTATRYQETLNSARMNGARAVSLRDRRVPSDLMRLFFRYWADDLVAWRDRQIGGVSGAISELYQNFPLFKTLDAADVTGDPALADDAALSRRAAEAYAELLNDVDEAIVSIGSGDIHPFDLPQAVRATETSLPENVRSEFARIRQEHEVTRFWTTMGLTLAQVAAVFIPVVGPAIAVGIGVVSTAIDLENLMDRVDLAQASINPDGEMLGAAAPGAFDYAMAAAQVILTAADIGALASELRGAGRGALEAADRPPDIESGGRGDVSDATAGGHERPVDADAAARSGEGGHAPPPEHGAPAARRTVLDETAPLEGPQLSPSQRTAEIEAVQAREAQPSSVTGYVDEVPLENGHTWRRRSDGTWCRFSGGPSLCGTDIPGVEPALGPGGRVAVGAEDLARLRETYGLAGDVNTVAAGRTDVPGLEGTVFASGSRGVRAGAAHPLPDATPHVFSPRNNLQFIEHAEEGIANQFIDAVESAGLRPADLEGRTLAMHISEPTGVCSACKAGLSGSPAMAGPLQDLSTRYPGLTIRITWNDAGGAQRFLIVGNGEVLFPR